MRVIIKERHGNFILGTATEITEGDVERKRDSVVNEERQDLVIVAVYWWEGSRCRTMRSPRRKSPVSRVNPISNCNKQELQLFNPAQYVAAPVASADHALLLLHTCPSRSSWAGRGSCSSFCFCWCCNLSNILVMTCFIIGCPYFVCCFICLDL